MGNHCYFWAGDIITSFRPGQWFNKRVKVRTVESGGKLYGTIIGDDCVQFADGNLSGLALLERKNYTFKVGDKLIVQDSRRTHRNLTVGKTGKIIVINPEEGILYPFLAEFDSFEGGQDGILSWPRDWFPGEYKNPCRSRLWISGNNGIEKYLP